MAQLFTNSGFRVSGTQRVTGRYPLARRASRCFRTRSRAAPDFEFDLTFAMPELLHVTDSPVEFPLPTVTRTTTPDAVSLLLTQNQA